jgi:transcriptional regulator with XRE-family HTH domain
MAQQRPALARKLRELRELRWSDYTLTQAALAKALGGDVPLGSSTISSWENPDSGITPNARRLAAYATFFATRRSIDGGDPRVLPEGELDDAERAERDKLLAELVALREGPPSTQPTSAGMQERSSWWFPDLAPVRLICGRPPAEVKHPYALETSPNYIALLSFADTDAMVELFGHVRAMNPASDVRFMLADDAKADDLTGHVVLLGGLGSTQMAGWFNLRVEIPVAQVVNDKSVKDGDPFVLTTDGKRQRLVPTFSEEELIEDIGLLARMPNPLNTSRTLTVCNGVCGRGVLGAVRCLTDRQLRDGNEAYLAERFGGASRFGLVVRVPVFRGRTLTPDLNNPSVRLYEWPEKVG